MLHAHGIVGLPVWDSTELSCPRLGLFDSIDMLFVLLFEHVTDSCIQNGSDANILVVIALLGAIRRIGQLQAYSLGGAAPQGDSCFDSYLKRGDYANCFAARMNMNAWIHMCSRSVDLKP